MLSISVFSEPDDIIDHVADLIRNLAASENSSHHKNIAMSIFNSEYFLCAINNCSDWSSLLSDTRIFKERDRRVLLQPRIPIHNKLTNRQLEFFVDSVEVLIDASQTFYVSDVIQLLQTLRNPERGEYKRCVELSTKVIDYIDEKAIHEPHPSQELDIARVCAQQALAWIEVNPNEAIAPIDRIIEIVSKPENRFGKEFVHAARSLFDPLCKLEMNELALELGNVVIENADFELMKLVPYDLEIVLTKVICERFATIKSGTGKHCKTIMELYLMSTSWLDKYIEMINRGALTYSNLSKADFTINSVGASGLAYLSADLATGMNQQTAIEHFLKYTPQLKDPNFRCLGALVHISKAGRFKGDNAIVELLNELLFSECSAKYSKFNTAKYPQHKLFATLPVLDAALKQQLVCTRDFFNHHRFDEMHTLYGVDEFNELLSFRHQRQSFELVDMDVLIDMLVPSLLNNSKQDHDPILLNWSRLCVAMDRNLEWNPKYDFHHSVDVDFSDNVDLLKNEFRVKLHAALSAS